MIRNDIKLLDKVHVQPYIYLFTLLISNQIEATVFETLFLQVRREDKYWFSGQFDERVSGILDRFFLDVDAYVPGDLFNSNDKLDIDEVEFRKRAGNTLSKLKDLM